MSSTTKTVAKAAGIMMAAIFVSRLLGLVRIMVIGDQFGVGGEVSAYRFAFNLPDTLYFLISSGVLQAAFIPVFTEYWTKGKEEEAWKIFSIIATFVFLLLTSIIIICEVFAKPIVGIVAYGFVSKHPEMWNLTTVLTRIVLPSQLFFFMGGLITGTLQARQHFTAPAIGPIIYNIFIIAGALFLAETFGIAGLSWGALIGSFVGIFLLQIIVVRKIGVRFKPSLNLRHPGVKQVGRMALPVILGLSLPYVDVIINSWFAGFLPNPGAAAALEYANRLMQMPLGIFAQATAVALLPTLAAQAARNEIAELRRSINFGFRGILLMTIPSSVLMVVLATPIVRAILQHGQFKPNDAPYVGFALVFYAIGIAGWAGQAVVTRGFYALQATVVPVVTGTVATIIFIPLNWLLMKPMGHGGLALATSIAVMLNMLALLELLRRRLGGLNLRLIVKSLTKVTFSSAVAGAVAWAMLRLAAQHVDITQQFGALAGVIIASVPALVVYVGMIALLKVDEAAEIWGIVSRRLKRRAAVAEET